MSYIAEIMAQPYLLTRSFAGRQFTTLPGEAPVSTPVVVPQIVPTPVVGIEVGPDFSASAAAAIPDLLVAVEFRLALKVGRQVPLLYMRRRNPFGQQPNTVTNAQGAQWTAVFPPGSTIFGSGVLGLSGTTNAVVRKVFSQQSVTQTFLTLGWNEVFEH